MTEPSRVESASACVARWTELAALSLGARHAVATWDQADEPWTEVIEWTDGRRTIERTPPESLDPVVQTGAPDLCYWPGSRASVLTLPDGSEQQIEQPPLANAILQRLGHADAILMAFRIGDLAGHLVLADLHAAPDAATFALARSIQDELHQVLDLSLAGKSPNADARLEERMRLARELHDGVAQTLTAIGLHLRAAERLLATAPDDARTKLALARQLVLVEQRDLRFFIRDLKPAPLGMLESATPLKTLLTELTERFKSTWGLVVEFVTELPEDVDSHLRYEIYRVIQEALLNAARHGEATFADVAIRHQDGQAQITIRDNGRGFAFQGHYDHWELTAQQRGPVVLKQRVVAVGGNLSITSTDAGATLDILIPLSPDEERDADSDPGR